MRLVWLLFSGLLAFTTGCNNNAAPTPFVVGHVSDKTRLDKAGDQAELGLRLAVHELTQDAKVTEALGGRTIQVRHTDTRGNLDAFESQAVRLESVNRVLALFGGVTGPEAAALDHVKIPILTFHGHPVAGAGKHVFYLGITPERQGAALANTLAENLKIKRVAVLIDERRPESAVSADSFAQTLTARHAGVKAEPLAVTTIRFGKDAKWDEFVERMQAHDVQAIYFAGGVQDFNDWYKTWRKAVGEMAGEILYAGGDGDQRAFDVDAHTPILLATAFAPDSAAPKTVAFQKAFRDAFQTDADVHAALAYDGMRLLADALKRSNPQLLTADRLREELLKTKDFDGLTGPLTITAEQTVDRPISVVRWRNKSMTTLKKQVKTPEKKEK